MSMPIASPQSTLAVPTPAMRGALAGLSLSMLLSSLGTSVANVALPTLASEFGASFGAVQWVTLAYLLAITASIVAVGRLGDVVGRRRALRAGLALFTVASAVSGLSHALWMVIVARALQGLGAAVMMALTIALVSEILPKNKTGSAMGWLGATSAIGTALGPSLGGLLIAEVGWRAIFLVNVLLGAIALFLVHRHLPIDRAAPRAGRPELDVSGTVLLALILAAYALAMTLGHGAWGPLNLALGGAAVLGTGLFLVVERRASSPLVPLGSFRDLGLTGSLASNLLVSTVLMATLVVGPFHLSMALRLDAGMVGGVMSIGPIVAALTGLPAGRLVDHFGAGRMALLGLLGIALGCTALALLPESLGIPGYVGPIMVVTAGYALFQAANNTAVMKDVSADRRGVISGMLSLSRNLGLITGAAAMGAVFALASGASDLTTASAAEVATGMRITFGVAAGLVVLAMVIAAGQQVHRVLGISVLLLFPGLAAAQDTVPPSESASDVSVVSAVPAPRREDPSFMLRSDDGVNSLRVMGLFQLQYSHDWLESNETDSFSVHRARIGVTGTVLSRDLRYLFVAEFGGGDPRLLFLTLDYTLVADWLTVRVGQFKIPFSRSFITMASQLSMIDRPLTVGPNAFGDTADIGVMLHNGSSGPFEYAVGVFGGGGAGALPDRVDPLVAVRVGYNTEGLVGYVESDLEGGAPRFGIAAAGLVDFDADGDHESFVSGVVDLLFKAYGFALSSAFWVGSRQGGPSWSDQHYRAIGHATQMSYFVSERFEPVLRYAFSMPAGGAEDQHDFAGGFNLYFLGTTCKLQNFVSVRLDERTTTPEVHFQAQLSLSL